MGSGRSALAEHHNEDAIGFGGPDLRVHVLGVRDGLEDCFCSAGFLVTPTSSM